MLSWGCFTSSSNSSYLLILRMFHNTIPRLQGTDEGEGCDVRGQSRDEAQNDQVPWLTRVEDLGFGTMEKYPQKKGRSANYTQVSGARALELHVPYRVRRFVSSTA